MSVRIQDKLIYDNCLNTYPYFLSLATHSFARLRLLNPCTRQSFLKYVEIFSYFVPLLILIYFIHVLFLRF